MTSNANDFNANIVDANYQLKRNYFEHQIYFKSKWQTF